MTKSFREFLDKKHRESNKQLRLLAKLLEHEGFEVKEYLDDKDDPYVFLKCDKDISFGGVRIYKIGDIMAYRVQKDKDTHPYGRAYQLNIEEMFNDLMSENGSEEKTGKKIIESVVGEFRGFFDKSAKAEKEIRTLEIEKGDNRQGGTIMARNISLDYSSTIGNMSK